MKYLTLLLLFFSFLNGKTFAQNPDSLSHVNDSLKLLSLRNDTKNTTINTGAINVEASEQVESLNELIGQLNSETKIKKEELKKIQAKLKKLNQSLLSQKDSLDALSKNINIANEEIDKQKEKLEINNNQLRADSLDVDSLKSEVSKNNTTIQNQLSQLQKLRDSFEIAGVIEMRHLVKVRRDTMMPVIKNGVPLLKKNGRPVTSKEGVTSKKDTLLQAKSVYIKVQEGVILEINVTTSGGMFRNRNSIVDFLHFDSRGDDKLYFVPQDYRKDRKEIFLYLDDVLKYTPVGSFQNIPYADFDVTLVYDDSVVTRRYHEIKEGTSLNSYFGVAAFTDIKGIAGEPNALVQFNASAKFITRTKNIKNSAMVPLHFLSFQGGIAKFDNDFRGTQLFNEDSISRRDLFQRTRYSIGAKLNLIRGFASPQPRHLFSDWQINLGTGFAGSRVYDTIFKDAAKTVVDTNYRNITSIQSYLEPTLTVSRKGNFSMSLTFPIYANFLTADAKIKNSEVELWGIPGISLMYFGKRESGNKLFFRCNYYFNFKNKKEAFSQIQLGYSVNLTDLFSSVK